MRICLTGGIACGKSLAARYLNEFGVATIDADDIVHELIPDPAERRRLAAEVFADPAKRRALEVKIHPLVKERIEEFLGEGRRKKEEAEGRGKKEEVEGRSKKEKGKSAECLSFCSEAQHKEDASATALFPSSFFLLPSLRLPIIPLLFEVHWDADYDVICCVASERETQIVRMTATRGYSREEAEARLAAQMPVAEKAAKSHYVIHNDGTPEELKEEVRKFLDWLKSRLAQRPA